MDCRPGQAPVLRASKPISARWSAERLVNRGELRSTKIGRRTLVAVEDIDAFVDRKLAST